ncbi:TetR/AcrR family transcriptional regulator [Gilvimarinus xylanilyticus]|uniref:TetR/AcrR family transcriptional regulator n=1 Tax=Gilvimarinus xylanilyticus TaxID=2944139 RepID=A0A9X2I1W0_9GAMM|nr:TetR/AcrR family transcriptional regulator [Gilvimarinus xylanilyticus]MCP8900601.1 TetR/AcrR family transcriptional regulator [Gilvimarinus xylanilyticus]
MTKKKTGRPLSFDRGEALLASMHVFWAKGYEGASIKDLTSAMGINSPSLYAAFGDKHQLYLQAIDHYASNDACAPLVAFETEPDIVQAVRSFLLAVIDYSVGNSSGVRGCFLSSCVSTSAGEVEGAQERLHSAIAETDARIARRFELEKARGALPESFPSFERAQLMLDLRQGYVFRCRAGQDADSMRADIEFRVNMVLAPPLTVSPD